MPRPSLAFDVLEVLLQKSDLLFEPLQLLLLELVALVQGPIRLNFLKV